MIKNIVDHLAPDVIKKTAVGYESAAQLLITAGDNPERLTSEAVFAALCGASRSQHHRERPTGIGSIGVVIGKRILLCI